MRKTKAQVFQRIATASPCKRSGHVHGEKAFVRRGIREGNTPPVGRIFCVHRMPPSTFLGGWGGGEKSPSERNKISTNQTITNPKWQLPEARRVERKETRKRERTGEVKECQEQTRGEGRVPKRSG